ncbi:MAG: DUF4190 domain-containing protein [Planctomycetota bacterium]
MTQLPTASGDAGRTNGLAIAGFVVSLLGLIGTAGLLCPIGLILSLIALGRGPSGRGFAVAGVILGAFGTCGGALALIFAGGAILAVLAAVGIGVAAIALAEPERTELTRDMIFLAAAIRAYEAEHRYLPADLSDLDVDVPLLTDPWGNRYEYRLTTETRGFDLVSYGTDGQPGTDDDVYLSRLGEAWAQAGNISVKTTEGGTVSVTIGDHTLEVTGGDDEGVVEIDMGNQVLRIKEDDEGGSIDVIHKDDAAESESIPPLPPG